MFILVVRLHYTCCNSFCWDGWVLLVKGLCYVLFSLSRVVVWLVRWCSVSSHLY